MGFHAPSRHQLFHEPQKEINQIESLVRLKSILFMSAMRRYSVEVARSLGQFLETRTSFLSSLDQHVQQVNTVNRKRELLEKATALANQLNVSVDHIDCPELTVADFQHSTTVTPPEKDELTLRTMLECGMHLGHATSKWCPRMVPFIYGVRSGIHIIDLEKSLACLRQACKVVKHLAGKPEAVILFVGCREEKVKRLTYEVAVECHQYYVNTRWTPGTLTNATAVLGNQMALHHAIGADPATATHRPSLLVLLEWNPVAVAEAERAHCPTIALCDTNNDPTAVTYPIPANDDAFAAVELVARLLGKAAREGRVGAAGRQAAPDKRIVDAADRFARQALDQWHPALFH